MTSHFRIAIACALLATCPATAQTGQPAPIVKPVDVPITLGFSREIRSRILGDLRRVNVLLPGHAADPGRRFPVMFLLDGGIAEDFVHNAGLTRIKAAYGQGQEVRPSARRAVGGFTRKGCPPVLSCGPDGLDSRTLLIEDQIA